MQISAGRLRPRDVIDARITIAVGGISIYAFYVDVEPMHATLDVLFTEKCERSPGMYYYYSARITRTYVVLI